MLYREITSCAICGQRYRYYGLDKEKKHGVMMKPGKTYCLFPKKKAVRIDGRYHSKIPPNCPRRGIPATYQLIYLGENRDTTDYLAYDGPLDETLHEQVIRRVPVVIDDCLFHNGKPVARISGKSVITRSTGFKRESYLFHEGRIIEAYAVYHKEEASPLPKKQRLPLDEVPPPAAISRYAVFDKAGNEVVIACLYHMEHMLVDNEREAFVRRVKEARLYWQDMSAIDQLGEQGATLRSKLCMLGWVFYIDGPEYEPRGEWRRNE